MKRLIYLRHAKSSWADFSLADHDRPLNTRGKRDAPFMAIKLKELGISPQLILCSSAKRTKLTLKYFTKEFNFSAESILYQKSLYHASQETLESVIYEINPEIKVAMVIAHNPGLTFLLDHYCDQNIDNVPTSGLFIFKSESADWNNFFSDLKLEHFIYPKKYL